MRFLLFALIALGVEAPLCFSEEGSKPDSKPDLSTGVQKRVVFPSPYIRLIGMEMALKKAGGKVDWPDAYKRLAFRDIRAGKLPKEKAVLAFAIGSLMLGHIRASMDGDK